MTAVSTDFSAGSGTKLFLVMPYRGTQCFLELSAHTSSPPGFYTSPAKHQPSGLGYNNDSHFSVTNLFPWPEPSPKKS